MCFSFSHILSENCDDSKTLSVLHLPQYLDWAEDIHLETRILKLREVCWLHFAAQLKLPKGRFNIYFKMKRGVDVQDPNNRWNDRNNIQNDYQIILNENSDEESVGFLYNIANISKTYWSWLPVCTSSAQSKNTRKNPFLQIEILGLFELEVKEERDVRITLFNENGYWTRGLAWHAITFVQKDPPKPQESSKIPRFLSASAQKVRQAFS